MQEWEISALNNSSLWSRNVFGIHQHFFSVGGDIMSSHHVVEGYVLGCSVTRLCNKVKTSRKKFSQISFV